MPTLSLKRKPQIAVFIDAGNLWGVYKALGKMLKMDTLQHFFSEKFTGTIFRVFYYVAFPRDGTRPDDQLHKLHNYFTYLKKGLKFDVVKKPLKTIFLRTAEGELIYDQTTGKPQSREKGNFDVEITIDALKYSSAYDTAVFISGDSDFLPLVTYLRNIKNKKKVYIFSTEESISTELRTGGDGYFDLKDFPQIHGDKLKARENR